MMTKKLFLCFAALFICTCASAQSLRLGLKAGVGLSSVRNDALSKDFTYKFKLHGGLMVNLPLSELLHLQSEVVYSQKGFEYKNGNATSVLKSAYIDVPLLARVNLDAFFVEAGPQVSFLLKSEMNDADIKPATKSTVFGYALGLGYQANHFTYGLRYSTDVSDSYVHLLGRATEAKNTGFQLSVGYLINQ
jgi:hypothetical protein